MELSSGFERSLADVAIKVSLSKISNLPKSTSLFLDESFATLDADNLASMHTLLQALKNNYEHIVVISHLDEIKDAVDKIIEITHENGLAKVVFE